MDPYQQIAAALKAQLKQEDDIKEELCSKVLKEHPECGDALGKLKERFFEKAEGSEAVKFNEVLQWLQTTAEAQPQLRKSISLKKQKTGELDEDPAGDQEALNVRTAAGSLILTVSRKEVDSMLVAQLRKNVADQLARCVDEVKLVADEKQLQNDEACKDILGSRDFLEVLVVTQQIPPLDPSIGPLQQMDTLKLMIMSSSREHQIDAATHYRKILSIERDPPIDTVLETGIGPRLLELCQVDESPQLQFETLWAICNIVSGSQDQTTAMVQLDAVSIITKVLTESKNFDVLEQGVWALGNIAGDSVPHRNHCFDAGALPIVLQILDSTTKISCARNAVWTVSNFCRGKPAPDLVELIPVIPVIARYLRESQDQEVICDALWCMSYISDGPNANIQAVIDSGICNRLVELLAHAATLVQTPALRTVANLVTGDDAQTDAILACNPYDAMLSLLKSQKNKIRQECCWMISNICAGTLSQIHQVHDKGLLSALNTLAKDTEFSVRKEVAFAFSNASEKEEMARTLIESGSMQAIQEMMRTQHDERIQNLCITFITNVWKALMADGWKTDKHLVVTWMEDVEELIQNCHNEGIRNNAKLVLMPD
ncbi:unnamed protein product [Durusdinium trenchii]|uniref:Importin subunit alpha n=1 Tax=Durusdinium trenchii TaxID=1381693 RepID=A0ABP0PHB4_9DINO